MRTLRCGNHGDIKVIRVFENGSAHDENLLHHHFRDLWIKGEWFRYDKTMLTISLNALRRKYAVRQRKRDYDTANTVLKATRWPKDVYEALNKLRPRNKKFSSKAIEGARLLIAESGKR